MTPHAGGLPDVVYHAARISPTGPATVSVHTPTGDYLGPLPHHPWHSPDGFQWGYHGNGPTDLARCLLIHAWGPDAYCTRCNPDQRVPASGEQRSRCRRCHRSGLAEVIADYPTYKTNVLAVITANQWTTTSDAVRTHHRITPAHVRDVCEPPAACWPAPSIERPPS